MLGDKSGIPTPFAAGVPTGLDHWISTLREPDHKGHLVTRSNPCSSHGVGTHTGNAKIGPKPKAVGTPLVKCGRAHHPAHTGKSGFGPPLVVGATSIVCSALCSAYLSLLHHTAGVRPSVAIPLLLHRLAEDNWMLEVMRFWNAVASLPEGSFG